MARHWRTFLLPACGLSVPVGALARIGASVSAAKNSVPGAAALDSLNRSSTRTLRQQLMRLQRRGGVVTRRESIRYQTKPTELERPLGWHVAQGRDANASGQPTFDGSLDQARRDEGH